MSIMEDNDFNNNVFKIFNKTEGGTQPVSEPRSRLSNYLDDKRDQAPSIQNTRDQLGNVIFNSDSKNQRESEHSQKSSKLAAVNEQTFRFVNESEKA